MQPAPQPEPEPLPKTPADLLLHHSKNRPNGPLFPRFECLAQPGAREFLLQLAEISLARDAAKLAPLVSADMRYLYVDHPHLKWGKAEWMESARTSPAPSFDRMADLISLGCASTNPNQFVIPWHTSQAPPPGSKFGYALAIGNDVPVFPPLDAPKETPKPRLASWEWVELTGGSYTVFETLVPVRLSDGTKGVMSPSRLRPARGFQMVVERRDGAWNIADYIFAGSNRP